MTKNWKHTAFTLAEVLITLGIIGIVAAMTIPTLISNNQDNSNKAAFKKIYSNLASATTSLLNENGGLSSAFASWASCEDVRNQYLSYFSAIKTCDQNNTICWHDVATTPLKNIVGSNMRVGGSTTWSSAFAGMQLKDGAFIRFRPGSSGSCNPSVPACALIFIDVNGFKKPNIFGKDIYFVEVVYPGILYPGNIGYNSQSYIESLCSKTCTDADLCGLTCGVKVLNNQDY